jgi:quinol monooxygenase YgiN
MAVIVHLVLFKLKPGIAKNDARVVAAVAQLRSLEGRVGGILEWEVGSNFTERPIASDFALYSTFADRDALAAYVPHPDHQAFVAKMRELADWTLVDYERAQP